MDKHNNSFDKIAHRLRTEFPGIKMLALGQTVYWDEPMKAILRGYLDADLPEAVMAVGIHDADYFSKVPATLNLSDGWYVVPHNDGATRDLWVATGEISRLFGNETIPSRDFFARHGVQFDKIARSYPGGRDALLDTTTEAWGWRGLVHVDPTDEVACCVPVKDAAPHLLKLLEWGFDRTLESLPETHARDIGRQQADELLCEVRAYANEHPDASVPDMFCEFLRKFYERLLGYHPSNLELTKASDIFRFNKSTAGLKRFETLGIFLDPSTRFAAQESYDLAVEGSDTYTLDRFPEGAIPFDLLVPGSGRGTICLRDGAVVIESGVPVSIPCTTLPSTPAELAQLIEEHFGPDTALIGKALTLILMIASEFIFVLNEQASAYVPRCETMAALMKDRGIELTYYPILRMDYHTWDSLRACDVTFEMPSHMAQAFHQGESTSIEIADSWEARVGEQTNLLTRLSQLSGVEEVLQFLAQSQGEPWPARMSAYLNADLVIRELSGRVEPLKAESVSLRDLSYQIKQEVEQLERDKGVHFREIIKPLRDELARMECAGVTSGDVVDSLKGQISEHEKVRAEKESEIERRRGDAQAARNKSLDLKQSVQSLEKGGDAAHARETMKTVEYEAELARLWLARDALLVSKGLDYTNHRPSAWWFLLADPELKWFNRVAETAEFRFEEIQPSSLR